MYCICPFNTSLSIIKQAVASGVLIYINIVFYCVSIKRSALCYMSSLGKPSRLRRDVGEPLTFALLPPAGLSWELVYSGPAKEHVCEGLKPGCSYQTRIYCLSEGGQSPVSHSALAHMHGPVSLATPVPKLWQSAGFLLVVVLFLFCHR